MIFRSKYIVQRVSLLFLVNSLLFCSINCSAQQEDLNQDVSSLLDLMRQENSSNSSWQLKGTAQGLMISGTGNVVLSGDENGKFRLELDSTIKIKDVHNGNETFKLFPWGTVNQVGAQEEEMTLIPLWVATGYWLSKDAPLEISQGPRRSDQLRSLLLRHRKGKMQFEVLVDSELAAPVSVKTFVGIPMTVWQFKDHKQINGWPVATSIKLVKGSREFMSFDLKNASSPVAADTWSKPVATAKVSFDDNASSKIPVKNDGNGYLFVRPIINGRQLGWFLFDTGAPATIIGKSALARLNLQELGSAQSTGVGGSANISIHKVESIQLGPLKVGPVAIASMDVSRLGWRNLPIMGILGSDMLNSVVVEYEIASSKIHFHNPDHYQLLESKKWIPIELFEGKPIASAKFEGYTGNFLIDSAAGGTFSISKHVVDQFGLLKNRRTQKSRSTGVGGGVTMRRGKIESLDFGGKRYKNVSTSFSTSRQGSYAHPYPDGIIGINLIDDYRVVFDLGRKRIALLEIEN